MRRAAHLEVALDLEVLAALVLHVKERATDGNHEATDPGTKVNQVAHVHPAKAAAGPGSPAATVQAMTASLPEIALATKAVPLATVPMVTASPPVTVPATKAVPPVTVPATKAVPPVTVPATKANPVAHVHPAKAAAGPGSPAATVQATTASLPVTVPATKAVPLATVPMVTASPQGIAPMATVQATTASPRATVPMVIEGDRIEAVHLTVAVVIDLRGTNGSRPKKLPRSCRRVGEASLVVAPVKLVCRTPKLGTQARTSLAPHSRGRPRWTSGSEPTSRPSANVVVKRRAWWSSVGEAKSVRCPLR